MRTAIVVKPDLIISNGNTEGGRFVDLVTYVGHARRRLLEEESFVPAEAHLPDELRPYVPALILNRESDDAILLAFITAELLPPGARPGVLERLAEVGERFALQGNCLLVGAFVFSGSLHARDVEEIEALRAEDQQTGVVRIPWIVDLESGIVAPHSGPPGGLGGIQEILSDMGSDPTFEVAEEPVLGEVQRQPSPLVTYVVLGIVLILFGLAMVLGGGLGATEDEAMLSRLGAADRFQIWLDGEWWRLGSAAFLHFGPVHLVFNGLALYQLGRMVEWLFGHWRYAVIFGAAALAGSAASLYLNFPLYVSAGASGGLYGLFGALVFFRLASPLRHLFTWQQILLPIGINFAFTLAVPNIDAWNHAGGLIGGFVAAAMVGLPELPVEEEARFSLPDGVHRVLASVLVLVSILLLLGRIPIGGPGQAFVQGLARLEQGRAAEAERLIRQGVGRWDDEWPAHFYLAIALAEQGKRQEALAAARRAVELDPKAPKARELLMELQRQR